MKRIRKLTLTDWTAANNALLQHFEGNKSKLAKMVRLSRTTVTSFFQQSPVGEGSFRKICLALRLNWQQVSTVDSLLDASNTQYSSMNLDATFSDLNVVSRNEVLIESVKKRCRKIILEQHSQMRLLSGEEIGVDQLYVDVWLLGKPERRHFDTSESLLSSFDIEKDRLALSKRIQRNPGFKIANKNPKLVILGKPGSGKTTFIKHLAVDWCKGKFQTDKIAVLIELRQIQQQTWDLVGAIKKELKLQEKEEIENFLNQGKFLIILDGLDEVPTNELRQNVQNQVKEIAKNYHNKNRFILTCRTQVMGTVPSGFTSVEVADFNSEQVKQFVQNWFMANGQSESEAVQQWETIYHAINVQPALRELTVTPVLLSLICVVLQDSGAIPTNRTNLYKKGINWLLSRWNDGKNFEKWEVGSASYRQLNIEDKEALLAEIAAQKFENPKNFILFEQDELASQICQKLYLENIQEGIGVLKAIEAQHGLLIERADELWSFSHLTFQQYFTVQWLTRLPLQYLAEKITNKQWQKVVEQLVKSQQPADQLLRIIKHAIDQSTTHEPDMQTFLNWLVQKSESVQTRCKRVVSRAFYYTLSLSHILSQTISKAHDRDRAYILDRTLFINDSLSNALSLVHNRDQVFAQTLSFGLDLDLDLDFSLAFSLAIALDLTLALDCSPAFSLALDRAIEKSNASDPELQLKIQSLKSKLFGLDDREQFQQWWRKYRQDWIADLRKIMIEHRNIGHDWELADGQKQQLQRYYEANKFLVDLMKIKGAVSEECRAEIEEGLLLPWGELQRRQPHLYGELEEF